MIYWDVRSASEHPELGRGLPPRGLLSSAEREAFARLRTAKRRQEWLLGRWAAKTLCRAWLARAGRVVAPAALTIARAPDGAPYAVLAGRERLPLVLSISHRADLALAALCAEPGVLMGADIELCEPRPSGFTGDFFTAGENAWLGELPAPARDRATTELWSLKESALKALRLGLTADTRRVEVVARGATIRGWTCAELAMRLGDTRRACGYLRAHGSFVTSIVRIGDGSDDVPSDDLRGYPPLMGGSRDGEITHDL